MDRSQKADAVAQLSEVFAQSGVVVVTRNLGLSVEQSTELRSKMREAGATYKVAKNRLAKLALKDTDYAGLDEFLTGPTALGYSEDPVAAAKAVVEFAKTTDKIEIVGGSMGAQKLDEAGVKALAAMPSLDELRGTIVGLVNAPATKVVRTIKEPTSQARTRFRCLWRQGSRVRAGSTYEHIFIGADPSDTRPSFGVKHHGRYRQAC